jgi:hypothetical protein
VDFSFISQPLSPCLSLLLLSLCHFLLIRSVLPLIPFGALETGQKNQIIRGALVFSGCPPFPSRGRGTRCSRWASLFLRGLPRIIPIDCCLYQLLHGREEKLPGTTRVAAATCKKRLRFSRDRDDHQDSEYHPSKSTTQPNYATRQPLGLKGYEDADERH